MRPYYFNKDLQGWGGNHNIFEEVIIKTRPKRIMEIGSWKGQSTLQMVKMLNKFYLFDSKIYCIDTWLGSYDFDNSLLMKKDGYPLVYYQFISNIRLENAENYIIPCPNTSNNYYHYFKKNEIKANLIYVDGSHLYEDVYNDIKNYYNLLFDNGIMFGDDFNFPDVKKAVQQFCFENKLEYTVTDNRYWRIL